MDDNEWEQWKQESMPEVGRYMRHNACDNPSVLLPVALLNSISGYTENSLIHSNEDFSFD